MPVDDPEPRRTQRQRRASSRELILDAAVRGLFEDGYARTTTVAIQTRAGVSRGRLLHHFPSREDLLVAAAQHLAGERIEEMRRFVLSPDDEAADGDGPTDGGERIDLATELLWATFRAPYFWAAMELWTAARTDADLAATLAGAERQLGGAINSVIAAMYGPVLSAHPSFPAARDLIFTSMRGVALTYAVTGHDPRTEPHLSLWKRVLREMLAAPEG
ncbi:MULTISPECIES: TetR/AcrR family transcriptional regulator [Frankia]|uniref:Transcriptional regulator of the TetR family n=1 Tax=Frankia alni (strain DSM 45986 / CECT 9034 / ACN14a) TaxID=326424 RepID=Q0RJ00_FRAAA|nr:MULTISPECIES: TetR/AcrR family transcriptional regulator [Frankia]CAJ62515.1 putative transcriptional regulator of the TetR family [Frankia alni ACN14a]